MIKYYYILMLLVSGAVQAQITLIPDSGFEQHLINEGIDTDGTVNGQVLTADIEDETELILGADFSINDLTGIQDFASLEHLFMTDMNLPQVDLSQNLNLKDLQIDDLALESLDLSQNTQLQNLGVRLDNPAGMYSSDLSELDLSQNVALEDVGISIGKLLYMDLSNNINLNGVSLNFMPELLSVNLMNGNNVSIDFLDIRFDPSLICIQVDDPAAVIAGTIPPYDNWTIENNDSNPLITDDCSFGIEDFLVQNVHVYPNPVQDMLYIEALEGIELKQIKLYNQLGQILMYSREVSQIDVSRLSTGLYLLSLQTDKGTVTKKVSKY